MTLFCAAHEWSTAIQVVAAAFGVPATIFACGWAWKHSGLTLGDPRE